MTDIAGERARLAAQALDIVYREQWGAVQSYVSERRVNRPARWLFLHISVTKAPQQSEASERSAMRAIEAIGEQRFGIGCSYNAAAAQSGRLYELQPLTRRGAHTVNDLVNADFPAGSLNYDARALVLPQMVGDEVTDAQVDAAARWGAALIRAGEARPGARWYGHRDVTAKACPGDRGYARLAELNRLTRHYEAVGLQEDDMPSIDEIVFAVRKVVREVVREELARDNDAADILVKGDGKGVSASHAARWYAVGGLGKRHIESREEADSLIFAGKLRAKPGTTEPHVWRQSVVDAIDDVATAPEPA